ncbi:MAG TPA: alpha/beta hydrolase, partial [Casimicrobiaceae bacterium]|nr:alpha/beta hydrolase [Casimicrobiaceae bacterium]
IRYVERGSGAPVILVHSFTGDFEREYVASGFFDAIAASHRAIGFDLRGHGSSGKPHDPARYGIEMGHDLVRLLDGLRIDRAHVLGYSLGAHIVAKLLAMHSDRFLTAILGGAPGRRNWTRDDDERIEREARELEAGTLHDQLLRLWPKGRNRPTEDQLRERSRAILAGNDTLDLAAVRRSSATQAITDAQLAALNVPVLGVVGSRDPYRAQFEELRAILADFRLVIIEGATHNNALARPEFLASVRAFLHEHVHPE